MHRQLGLLHPAGRGRATDIAAEDDGLSDQLPAATVGRVLSGGTNYLSQMQECFCVGLRGIIDRFSLVHV